MTTALATIETELKAAAPRMAMLVPKPFQRSYDVTKQVMGFAIEASRNAQLLDCTPFSVKVAFYHAASLGLEVGSVLGHAYLVPYKQTCQLIPGYRGLIYLAVRSGACRQIWAETIHENDAFAHRLGTDPKIEHQPSLGNRGAVIGAYACARLHGGGTQFVVLNLDEIEKVRAKSRVKGGPWSEWFEEMAKKTAIRRLVKQLSISTDEQRATFLRAVTVDGEIDGGADPDMVSATLGITEVKIAPEPVKAIDIIDAALDGAAEVDQAAAMAAADRAAAKEQR